MRSEVELVLAGQRYAGWVEARIERSIEQLAGAFALRVATRPGEGQALPAPLRPGLACELRVDGAPILTGRVDQVEAEHAADRAELRLQGRDASGDLVDCAALNTPGTWKNIALIALAEALCTPFGIGVGSEVAGLAPLPSFALEPGETVYEALERAARVAGVLILSDGLGGLRIAREGTERAPTALVYGENILRASVRLSDQERFSLYVVRGQAPGDDQVWGPSRNQPEGRATDDGVGRYRPHVVVAEGGLEPVRYGERADWEHRVRRGRSAEVTITVPGWHVSPDPGAGLWTPNTLVRVDYPPLGLAEDLLIAGVVLVRGEGGTVAELALYRPGTYDRIPLPAEDEGLGWPPAPERGAT
jgi:prophage tail gpP-like protein